MLFRSNRRVRYGVLCGHIIKQRFEPHHHLFTANLFDEKYRYIYHMNSEEFKKYLCGETLDVIGYNGYVAMYYNNYQVGYGKASNNQIKNKYPKVLRTKGVLNEISVI